MCHHRLIVILSFSTFVMFSCATPIETSNSTSISTQDLIDVGRSLAATGRTLVHHAFKRLMIILPGVFFLLGIAFTLLVLVTFVSVNNGFIGFLLLVVGLSSVLARLQEVKSPIALPYINPLSPYRRHLIDRADTESNVKANLGDTQQGYFRPGGHKERYDPLQYTRYVTTNQY